MRFRSSSTVYVQTRSSRAPRTIGRSGGGVRKSASVKRMRGWRGRMETSGWGVGGQRGWWLTTIVGWGSDSATRGRRSGSGRRAPPVLEDQHHAHGVELAVLTQQLAPRLLRREIVLLDAVHHRLV